MSSWCFESVALFRLYVVGVVVMFGVLVIPYPAVAWSLFGIGFTAAFLACVLDPLVRPRWGPEVRDDG